MTARPLVLVTGHLGFLGSHVVAALQARKLPVAGLDSQLYSAGTGPAATPPEREITKDLRDLTPDDLAGVTAVIHTAGFSTDALGDRYPESTLEINREATRRLVTLARDAGVTAFVFASSVGVYAPGGDDWLDEDSPTDAGSVYRRSKLDAERALLELRTAQFRPLVLRLPTMYGDSPSLRLDLVLNRWVFRAVAGLPIEIDGPGLQWRALAHVRDVAEALVTALEVPPERAGAGIANVCREDTNWRVVDLAHAVQAAFPGLDVVHRPPPPSAMAVSYRVRSRHFDTWLPGFRFARGPAEAIAELRTRFASRPLTATEEAAAVRAGWVACSMASGALDPNARPTADFGASR